MMHLPRPVVSAAALVCLACGSEPVPPGPSPILTQRTLVGTVQNMALQPVSEALVTIVGANLSALTSADGRFELSGPMNTPATVRISKQGFVTQTRTLMWTCAPSPVPCDPTTIAVRLESAAPSVDVTGSYAATLTADSTCADLPSEAHSRTWAATITPGAQVRSAYGVTLRAPSLVNLDGNGSAWAAGVAGDFLFIDFRIPFYSDVAIVDQLASDTYLLAGGTAGATVAPGAQQISATFDGFITYCALKPGYADILAGCGPDSEELASQTPARPVSFAECRSRNHRMVFTRQ